MIRLLLALLGVALLAVLAIKMIPQSMRASRLKAQQQISDSNRPEGSTPGAAPAATTPGGLNTPTTPAQEIRAIKREVNEIMRQGEQARQKQLDQQGARY